MTDNASPSVSQKQSHTPGPWGISLEGRSRLLVNDSTARHTTICQVMAGYVGDKEARANARLIAAAPDLLAACEEAWEFIFARHSANHVEPVLQKLTAAINKADGRQ